MWSSSHLSAHYIGAHSPLVELTQSWPLIGWTSEVCYELLSLDATEVSTTTVTAPQQQRWGTGLCCGDVAGPGHTPHSSSLKTGPSHNGGQLQGSGHSPDIVIAPKIVTREMSHELDHRPQDHLLSFWDFRHVDAERSVIHKISNAQ